MSFLDSLADFLEQEGIGTVNTDLFTGELPIDSAEGVSIMVSPSPAPNKAIPYFVQTVDIWARYKKYDDGYNKLQEIYDVLHAAANYQIDGYHVYLSYAEGLINDNDRDLNRRHLFSLTFAFTAREDSTS